MYYDTQMKSRMCWISSRENPGRERNSFLRLRSKVTMVPRHSSDFGISKYLTFLFTSLDVRESVAWTLHILHNVSSVLPRTVLLSVSKSLARILTGSLVLLLRDLKKVTYLEDNMTLGCMEYEIVSIRYLCVYLLTLKICLIATFHHL